jgi:Zn-dependent protease
MNVGKFFQRQITVARVYGIPVRIDYRWFFVFGLSAWLISTNMHYGAMRLFTATFEHGAFRLVALTLPHLDIVTSWFLGIVTTLALFLSVFGHELSHALMGRAEGIEIEEIVLHPFGGLTRLKHEPDNPRAEFRIAVAGPAASFLFGVVAFAAMSLAVMIGQRATAAVFFFLCSGNLLLAISNLLPGYPLDGGRALRALLWHRGGNIKEATRIASLGGQLIAWTLVVYGVYVVFAWKDSLLMGLWSVVVGLFLRGAAASVVKHDRGTGEGTVGDAMTPPVAIEPDVLVSHFIDSILPLYRQTSFPVAHERRLHGILALEDLKSLPRERWRQTRARDVMRPIDDKFFVEPSTTMTRAEELMQHNGIGSLAVIDPKGLLVGFLQHGVRKRRTGKKSK